jgi:hypothetical protein
VLVLGGPRHELTASLCMHTDACVHSRGWLGNPSLFRGAGKVKDDRQARPSRSRFPRCTGTVPESLIDHVPRR